MVCFYIKNNCVFREKVKEAVGVFAGFHNKMGGASHTKIAFNVREVAADKNRWVEAGV